MEKLVEQELGRTAVALSAESVPELGMARKAARQQALFIIENSAPKPDQLQFAKPNLVANPITAAERILRAQSEFGLSSPEYSEAYKGALTDSRRALMEAYRKTTWEYFPPLIQKYDNRGKQFIAHGRSISQLTRDGLRWDEHLEERLRLVNEYVEEQTYVALRDSELAKTHWALTISQCPDHASESSGEGYGYVPSINKMMIRGVGMSLGEQDLDVRYTEQVGLPGLEISEATIHRALATIGVIQPNQTIEKTDLHGTQILIDKSKLAGVIDFVELLDDLAGEDVFMGQSAPGVKQDYQKVESSARARQKLLDDQANELTQYMLGLVKEGVDQAWAAGKVQIKVDQLIHKRASVNPLIAKEAFDDATAKGYEQAINLDRLGKYQDAGKLRVEVARQAPQAAYCGAGSCGLRAASPFEQNQGELLGMKGPLILDMVRRCPRGHKNSILYDSVGTKACRHCKLKQEANTKKVYQAKSDHKNKTKSSWWS